MWNDFRTMHEPDHFTFLYDVAVGEGRDPGENYEFNIRSMAIQLSKRRIDVVGILFDRVEIFELTQLANLKAIGQALIYVHWLTVTWQLTVPVTATIICRACQPDILPVLQAQNVRLVTIPTLPDTSQPHHSIKIDQNRPNHA